LSSIPLDFLLLIRFKDSLCKLGQVQGAKIGMKIKKWTRIVKIKIRHRWLIEGLGMEEILREQVRPRKEI